MSLERRITEESGGLSGGDHIDRSGCLSCGDVLLRHRPERKFHNAFHDHHWNGLGLYSENARQDRGQADQATSG